MTKAKKTTVNRKFLLIEGHFDEWRVYEINNPMSENDALENFEYETGEDASNSEIFLCDATQMKVIKGYTLKPME